RSAEVSNLRKHFLDDVKVNTDTFDDCLETVINLRQQAQSLAVTQITQKHTFNRLAALRRMQKAPYVGRIDFTEEGEPSTEKIY
ncbi:helicase, partial [Bacillus cereus]|nr:helicase [Bacillus cereus]